MGWDIIGDVKKGVEHLTEDVKKNPLQYGTAGLLPVASTPGFAAARVGDQLLNQPKGEGESAEDAFKRERRHQDYLQRMKELEGDVASVKWHSAGRRSNFAGQTDTDIRRQLNKGLTDITYGANKRGLLGSGLQKAAEGQAIGQAGSAYDEAVAKYNKQDEDMMNAYDNALIEAKQQQYADDTNAAELAYKKALDKAQKWEQGRSLLFQGGGTLLSSFLANRG